MSDVNQSDNRVKVV